MYLDQTEVEFGLYSYCYVQLLNSCDSQLIFTFAI